MDTITLDNDVTVLAQKAASFPEGIMASYNELFKKLPEAGGRTIYGLSRPEDGLPVVYYAAVEKNGEANVDELGLKEIVIKKGTYIYRDIKDYMNDLPAIGTSFMEMLHTPGLDPMGYCVEEYLSQKDVRLMIRMA